MSVFTPEGEEISNIPYLFSCQFESFVVSEAFKREFFFLSVDAFQRRLFIVQQNIEKGKAPFFFFFTMIKLTSFFDEFGVMTESWQMIQFVHLFQLLRKIVHLKKERARVWC